jgi:hypothetical protein
MCHLKRLLKRRCAASQEDELADRLAGTHVSHDSTPDWVPGKPPATAKADPAKPAVTEPEPAADEGAGW